MSQDAISEYENAINVQNNEGAKLTWKDVFQVVSGFKYNQALSAGMDFK